LLAGIAAHSPKVIAWAEDHLDVDYYLCSYYNPIPRDEHPEHIAGLEERYLDEDRARMLSLIPGLSRPVIHYKILAAGRNDPAQAFQVAASAMRSNDMVCIGIYDQDNPEMLRQDVALFENAIALQAAHQPVVTR
jgi:hypothetical protein